MSLWRKKPVVIEAVQWNPSALVWSDWQEAGICHPAVRRTSYQELSQLLGTSGNAGKEGWGWAVCGIIETLEGPHVVVPGDWIITGVKDEVYPCKPDIFEATYEAVAPSAEEKTP